MNPKLKFIQKLEVFALFHRAKLPEMFQILLGYKYLVAKPILWLCSSRNPLAHHLLTWPKFRRAHSAKFSESKPDPTKFLSTQNPPYPWEATSSLQLKPYAKWFGGASSVLSGLRYPPPQPAKWQRLPSLRKNSTASLNSGSTATPVRGAKGPLVEWGTFQSRLNRW